MKNQDLKLFKFKSNFARRLKDPISPNKIHHFFWIKAEDLPENFPKDPNPRAQNLNRAVYKEVKRSYLNKDEFTPYTFHLKNNGMDLIAQRVDLIDKEENIFEVAFGSNEGVLNGYHTYQIILDNKDEVPDQYVFVKITTNVEKDFITEMAGGLNTSVQVHDESLLNQKGAFNWIKEELKPFNDNIAYKENLNRDMDIRDIVAIMTLFNIDLFPTDASSSNHPKYAYSYKSKCLQLYEKDTEIYEKLKPILKDIMKLHDIIKYTAPKKHDGHARRLDYFDTKQRTKMKLIFINKESDILLGKAALYPILAAFRWFVTEDDNDKYKWKTKNGFEDIQEIWNKFGTNVMSEIQGAYNDLGKSVNKLGKSGVTWTSVYSRLLSSFLQETKF